MIRKGDRVWMWGYREEWGAATVVTEPKRIFFGSGYRLLCKVRWPNGNEEYHHPLALRKGECPFDEKGNDRQSSQDQTERAVDVE